MADRGEKLQQLHCYHPFSDSRDTYLTKNHYENYSPKMVPTNPTGSWTTVDFFLMKQVHECIIINSLGSGICDSDLTHWPLGDLDVILKIRFSILFSWLVSWDFCMIMPSNECHRILLMISQHSFRWWLGAVRQQAITWAKLTKICVVIWWYPGNFNCQVISSHGIKYARNWRQVFVF